MNTPSASLQSLWSIDQDLLALVDSLDTCPEELRPELEAKIEQYVGAEIDKIDRVNAVYTAMLMQISSANLELKRLEDRKKSAERAVDRLENYLLHVLENRNGEPLRGKNVTFSVRRTESVIITDPEAVPAQFKVIKTTVDIPKTEIKKAIKAGEDVPGADIQYNTSLVRK